MRQYHTGNITQGDHWKFRSGSLPVVNERRRELCVLSTANNNHGREGKARGRTTSHDINMFITANISQAWHITSVLVTSVIRTPFGATLKQPYGAQLIPLITQTPPPHPWFTFHANLTALHLKTFHLQLPFFPVLGSFPSACSYFYIIHKAFLFSSTLLILHLRFGAVNSQFIYSSNCRRKLTAVCCHGVWCIMEMLLLWEKSLFKS